MVGPGELVMNDRGDGSVWIYALTGIRTVAGHFDPIGVSPDAALLGERFKQLRHRPGDSGRGIAASCAVRDRRPRPTAGALAPAVRHDAAGPGASTG